ncbi:MAG TPA: glutamate mutase L [Anaerolineales bacterium]|jgi:hypothetical protein
MPNSLVNGSSLLAVDIGTINTRAAYFDVIEGSYRFIGMGQSPTTANPPALNVMMGIQLAIENLQTMIGKALMDDDGGLIIPSQPDGIGVDGMVTTLSAGPAIKTLIVGLLPDVSLKSIENLARTTCLNVVESLQLNDPRRPDEQVDAVVQSSPELVLIAGGVDGGATRSIEKILEIVGLGIYLLPEARRPTVLFAGNKQFAQEVQSSLKDIASQVFISPNIRPSLDVEDMAPAQRQLANVVTDLRQKQMPELEQIRLLSGGTLIQSSYAQGRMVRFLSSYYGSGQGVLSVDVGASAISMGASFGSDLHLNVFPHLGLGEAMGGLLAHTSLEDIMRWLPVDIPADTVRDYIYQKSIYPGVIPATKDELSIEHAILSQNLLMASRQMLQRLPVSLRTRTGLLPPFEPILAGGAAITGAANAGQKLLLLLDGLQPAGITTLAIDQHNLLAMLGAIADVNTLLPVQAIDSGALSYLASVISPVSNAAYGTPIVHAKLIREDGTETSSEILMGDLRVLPLANRQNARLQLRPLHRADVGLGPGHAGEVDVTGSTMGVVIDARGRPLRLPTDPAKRIALRQSWLNMLGG